MELVIDANVLFSAVIKDSVTAWLLLQDDLDLNAPAYLFEEFEEYRETILERTHRDHGDFDRFLAILRGRILTFPRTEFERYEPEAARICPDPGDVPYFALALALEASLWSDDRALLDQSAVPVVSTNALLELVDP